MKFWNRLQSSLRTNLFVIILILTVWLKLIAVDAIMFDGAKGLSIIVFLLFTGASVLVFFSWAFLFNRFRNWAAVITSSILSVIIWADVVYFRYFGSLIKIESLRIAGQTTGVGDSILALFSVYDIFFFADILLIIIVLVSRRRRSRSADETLRLRATMFGLALFLSLASISSILFHDRSGELKKFIYQNYDVNVIEYRYGALGAHAINAYRYVLTTMERLEEPDRTQAVDWISKNTIGQRSNKVTGRAKGKNIFVIQIESLQSFVIGRTYKGEELTPNLNKLIRESYYFDNGSSVVGGGNTSDSDLATNTSIYPLVNSSAFVLYGRDNYTSLPIALKQSGYSTSAYHANARDFWNRGVAYDAIGFERFVSEEQFLPGERVGMGLNDESFYRQTLEKVSEAKSPSYNFLVSLSSHYPFILDQKYQTLEAKYNKSLNASLYNYFQSIHYADSALGDFIETLKERGLYEDSLIVLYGDHEAKGDGLESPSAAAMLGRIDQGKMDKIPFIYKLPGQATGYVLSRPTTQLDIMPTVLNLTATKTEFPMFGGDVLGQGRKAVTKAEAIHYSDLMIRFNLFEEFTK